MSKYGIWTRQKYSFGEWERMTQFGKELSFNTKKEAEEYIENLRSMSSPYEYEVRRI